MRLLADAFTGVELPLSACVPQVAFTPAAAATMLAAWVLIVLVAPAAPLTAGVVGDERCTSSAMLDIRRALANVGTLLIPEDSVQVLPNVTRVAGGDIDVVATGACEPADPTPPDVIRPLQANEAITLPAVVALLLLLPPLLPTPDVRLRLDTVRSRQRALSRKGITGTGAARVLCDGVATGCALTVAAPSGITSFDRL